jgi:hypothetical protein
VGTTDAGSAISTTDAVHIIGSAEATDGRLDFADWNAAGGMNFTVDDQFTANYTVQYFVASGDDLVNVSAGAFTWNTVTGTQDITGPGFQPDLLITAAYDGSTAPPATSGDASLSFGVAVGNATGEQYAYMGWADDATGTSDTFSYVQEGELLALGDSTTGPQHRAVFDRWLSNGFRINITETDATVRQSLYLVAQGGQWATGDILTRTDTANIVETGVGFQPDALMLLSHNRPESTVDTPDNDARWSMGAATSAASRLAMGHLDEDNKGTTEVHIGLETNHTYLHLNETDTGTPYYLRSTVSAGASLCTDNNLQLSTTAGAAQQSVSITTTDTTSPYFGGHCWAYQATGADLVIPAGTWTFLADFGANGGGGAAETLAFGWYECDDLTSCASRTDICELTGQSWSASTDDQSYGCSASAVTIDEDNYLVFSAVCDHASRCGNRQPSLLYNAAASSSGDSYVQFPADPLPPKALMDLVGMGADGFTSVMDVPEPTAGAFVFYLAGAEEAGGGSPNYTVEVQYDWTGVPTWATFYRLYVECTELSATEDVLVSAYNFTTPGWVSAYTCDQAADTTYSSFLLGTGELNAGAPRIRFNGSVESGDSTQDTFSLDYVSIGVESPRYRFEVRYDQSLNDVPPMPEACDNSAPESDIIRVHVQAYRANPAMEDVYFDVLTPPSTWNTRLTVTATSDTDTNQTYVVLAAEYNGGVQTRFRGSNESGDYVQGRFNIDVLSFECQYSEDYEAEVEYDWSAVNTTGNSWTLLFECRVNTTSEPGTLQVLSPPSYWTSAYVCDDTVSDESFSSYTLNTTELNSGAPKVRFLDQDGEDNTNTTWQLDLLLIQRDYDPPPPPPLAGAAADMLLWYLLAAAGILTVLGAATRTGAPLALAGICVMAAGIFIVLPSALPGEEITYTVATAAMVAVGLGEVFFGAALALFGE